MLEYAAKYKESLLFDRYKAGRDQIALGGRQAPFAYVVPQKQRDPVAAVELLRRLAFGGVRVWQAAAPITIDGQPYPEGTWVVPTDQEFAALAREVLDVQMYPDLRQYPGGPPERPYDAAGWTLPLQMGVDVVAVATPLAPDVRARLTPLGPAPEPRIKPVPYDAGLDRDRAPFDSVPGTGFDSEPAAAAIVPPPGTILNGGPALSLDPAQNNTFRALNRAWDDGATVRRINGRFVIENLSPDAQQTLVSSYALRGEHVGPSRIDATLAGDIVKRPRIGVFEPWTGGSMDAGWTRWVLEQYGFKYTAVHAEDFRSPLAEKVDVLVIADDARVPMAAPGARSTRAPAARTLRPEYAYELTGDDIKRLDAFVRGGGTLVCLGNGSTVAIQTLDLPVRNVVAGLRPEEFFLRGSIVQVTTDPSHPVMAGMPERAAVFVDGGPVFDIDATFTGRVLAKYQNSGSPLLSGYLIGERHLNGKAAALDVEHDAGHVVLIGFRPEWRGQPFGTFRVLFNAVLPGTVSH